MCYPETTLNVVDQRKSAAPKRDDRHTKIDKNTHFIVKSIYTKFHLVQIVLRLHIISFEICTIIGLIINQLFFKAELTEVYGPNPKYNGNKSIHNYDNA